MAASDGHRRFRVRMLSLFSVAIVYAAGVYAAGQNARDARAGPTPSTSELKGGWHLVRTPNPRGGPDAVSIMHTADTSRSDLDLAGLMIRCGRNHAEAIVVLLRAFSLNARPTVVLGEPGNETRLEAKVVPPGTAIELPIEAENLAARTSTDLDVRIEAAGSTIRGVVPVSGLRRALTVLKLQCPF